MTRTADTDPRPTPRQWLFAKCWGLTADPVNRTLAATKRTLLADIGGPVVEIGPGVGSNFEYYPTGTVVLAFETNPSMFPGMRSAAAEHGVDLELSHLDLRDAALPSDSYDTVISTLVLCSVDEPAAMVAEILRVLRPGGRFLFLEHIAPPRGTVASVIARVVRRPWAAFGDHCNVMAKTHEIIAEAGFSSTDARVEAFGGRFDPSSDHYWGVSVK